MIEINSIEEWRGYLVSLRLGFNTPSHYGEPTEFPCVVISTWNDPCYHHSFVSLREMQENDLKLNIQDKISRKLW